MADIQYKKGELLFNETFETSKPNEHYPYATAQENVSTSITENIVTKPPIIKMLLIALTIAEPSIPPRSAILMSS